MHRYYRMLCGEARLSWVEVVSLVQATDSSSCCLRTCASEHHPGLKLEPSKVSSEQCWAWLRGPTVNGPQGDYQVGHSGWPGHHRGSWGQHAMRRTRPHPGRSSPQKLPAMLAGACHT